MPPKFRELSSVDQFRVFRFLTRGDAPDDPMLAAIIVDVAEQYQTQSRIGAAVFRWLPMVLAICLLVPALPGAVDGDAWMMAFVLFVALGVIGNLLLNPWTRPRNVIKSAEASRRVLALGN